jgi:hypothetical protein
VSKVIARILLERIKPKIGKKLRKNQEGFQATSSTIDYICTLRIILKQAKEWQIAVNIE